MATHSLLLLTSSNQPTILMRRGTAPHVPSIISDSQCGLTEMRDSTGLMLLLVGYTFPRLLAQREEEGRKRGTSAVYSCVPIGLFVATTEGRQVHCTRQGPSGVFSREGQVRPSWHMGKADRDRLCNLNVFPTTIAIVVVGLDGLCPSLLVGFGCKQQRQHMNIDSESSHST